MSEAIIAGALLSLSILWRQRNHQRSRHTDVVRANPQRALKMPHQPEEGYALELNFCPRSTDIILATFPKTGNTLLSQLCHQLRCPGDNTFHDIYDVVPFLEFLWPLGVDDPNNVHLSFNDPRLKPRVFKHHRFLSACYSTGKYVCTFRDPERTFVSLYNMCLENGITNAIALDQFVEEFGLLNSDWGWGANIFQYYSEQYRCRQCENVLLLCYEDIACRETFHAQALLLHKFMGLKNDAVSCENGPSFQAISKACSKAWMLQNKHKFDESITYDNMRKMGRWISPFRPAARVTSGAHHAKVTVSASLRRKLKQMWNATLLNEFGLHDYEELRASINYINKNK